MAEYRRGFNEFQERLIARIGDIDDDRRMTAGQLQRAWQAHESNIEARWRRWRALLIGMGLILVAVSFIVPLVIYARFDAIRQELSAEIATLRADLEQISAITADDRLMQDKLAQLAETIGEVSSAFAQLDEASMDHQPPDSAQIQPIAPPEATATEALEPPTAIEPEFAIQSEPAIEPSASSTASPEIERQDAPSIAEGAPSLDETMDSPEPTETPTTVPVSANTTDDSAISIDKPYYALQLLGAFSRDGMLAFSRRKDLPAQMYWRQETFQNRPWYVLIHSLHSTQQEAIAARDALPSDIAKADLWIRELTPPAKLYVLDRDTAAHPAEPD